MTDLFPILYHMICMIWLMLPGGRRITCMVCLRACFFLGRICTIIIILSTVRTPIQILLLLPIGSRMVRMTYCVRAFFSPGLDLHHYIDVVQHCQ